MKRTIITALLAIISITNMQAGKSKGKITMAGKPGHVYSMGITNSLLPSNTKDKTFLTNSLGITANVFFPIIKSPSANFGFNVCGTYDFGGKGNPSATLPNAYNITGQTSSNVVYRGLDPRSPGFKTAFGPQANFLVGNRFVISPMVPVGFMSLTQKTLSAVQTTSYNGQTYEFNLATLPETKISGITVNPTLRLQYFVSKSVGFWIEGSYLTGPKVKTQITKLIPNGAANQQGNYDLKALQNASYVKSEVTKTSYNATGVSAGLFIKLGNNDGGNNQKQRPCKCCGEMHSGKCPKCNFGEATSVVKNTAELPKQVATTGDIKKGWDGTVKGLFNVNNPDILVSKNNGLENLVAQINKAKKGKASIVKSQGKEYIRIEETKNNETTFTNFPVNDSNPLGLTVPGASWCTGTCNSCMPSGFNNACACDETASSADFCGKVGGAATNISYYLSASEIKNIALALEPNGVTLSSGSIKNIKDLMLQSFPNATVTNTEIVQEEEEKFIKISLNDNGNLVTVFNRPNKNLKQKPNGPTWILIGCTGTCGGNISMCTSKNVNLLGGCYCGAGDNKCFGYNVSIPHTLPNIFWEN